MNCTVSKHDATVTKNAISIFKPFYYSYRELYNSLHVTGRITTHMQVKLHNYIYSYTV